MEINYVFVTFPGGTKSIMRMGVFREIFEGEVNNARVVDYEIWKMSLSKQLQFIKKYLNMDASNIIIFVPGAKFKKYVPKILVKELKKQSEFLLTVCCYLADGIERQAVNQKISIEECRAIFDCFDAIYSYDVYESQKYGFIYEPLPLKKFTKEELGVSLESEYGRKTIPRVFFCGRAKGRLPLILDIANSLDGRRIKYEFLVLQDAETQDMKDRGGVHFINYMVYDEVVRHVKESTCLLSLVAENNNMTSASYNEAIMYNKKLLTNCRFIEDNYHYDSRYMRSFQTVDEIDFDWIADMNEVNYGYDGYFSAAAFLEHIEADFKRGLLSQCSMLNKMNIIKGKATFKIDIHFSHIGWIGDLDNAQEIIFAEQIEAFRLANLPLDMEIDIEVRQKFGGYSRAVKRGSFLFVGSVGKKDPIMAFRINLDNDNYNIFYRAYLFNMGWTQYYNAGTWCGTGTESDCMVMQGLQIIVIKKSMNNNELIFEEKENQLKQRERIVDDWIESI